MSLRARLLVGLLVLSASGLLIFSLVSYTALRSYLGARVDQQVEFATFPLTRTLTEKAGRGGIPEKLRQRVRRQIGEPPSQDTQLPPGTYGELRDDDGTVLARTTFSYGESDLSRPVLPDVTELEAADDPITVAGTDGGPGFRVMTTATPAGDGTVVVAVPLTEFEETLDRLALIEASVAAAILIALGLLSWWLIRIGLRPLERIAETADAIASGDLSQRVEPANRQTEVGRLGLSLNEMLAQIERAFDQRAAGEERLRRFLADASHELRTPLSSIRGYSELFRLGAAADSDELETAMRRIESEALRMENLVNDLFTLARLDQVPERTPEQVDLVGLAEEACGDARIAASDREITLAADPEAIVEGNGDQLRQVLGNLLANALAHTPEGTPIDVSVFCADGHAQVQVRDHGPGLVPGSETRVFERFWRPNGSRVRSHGGAGLGLAIVKAIANAHGGATAAQNAPGGGASFQVTLPAFLPTTTPSRL